MSESTTAGKPVSPPATGAADATGKKSRRTRRLVLLFIGLAAVCAAIAAWFVLRKPALPAGFASGNGRLEATTTYISTKYQGRIESVFFNEGDTVEPGQVIARMDTTALQAQLREAEAQIVAAQDSRTVAQTQVDVKKADYDYAAATANRSRGLLPSGAVSRQEYEIDNAAMLASRASLAGAKASAVQTLAQIDAAKATADRLRAEINDATLVSPIKARIESRLAEPGETLAQGGRVYSIVDLSDVYMYVFLPEKVAGRVALGSQARIVLDAAPDHPIPAYVSYVSPMAQFTPKQVETAEERHNLTFRVKLQVDKARTARYAPLIKPGLPGMGYVRYATKEEWPAKLQPNTAPPAGFQPTGSASAPK
jgi:HlyD family secretion protein